MGHHTVLQRWVADRGRARIQSKVGEINNTHNIILLKIKCVANTFKKVVIDETSCFESKA